MLAKGRETVDERQPLRYPHPLPGIGMQIWHPACHHPCDAKQLLGGHRNFKVRPVLVVLPDSQRPQLDSFKGLGQNIQP